jgi:predicted Zn-ribbon and HTH transcriptional regulator
MAHTPERCPKCKGAMVQGFIFEFDGPLRKVSSWVEGAPEKSFWQKTKVRKEKIVPIGTYRCSVCGFLESYARDEFAAQ